VEEGPAPGWLQRTLTPAWSGMDPKLGGREVEGAAYGLTLLLASHGLSKYTLPLTTAGSCTAS